MAAQVADTRDLTAYEEWQYNDPAAALAACGGMAVPDFWTRPQDVWCTKVMKERAKKRGDLTRGSPKERGVGGEQREESHATKRTKKKTTKVRGDLDLGDDLILSSEEEEEGEEEKHKGEGEEGRTAEESNNSNPWKVNDKHHLRGSDVPKELGEQQHGDRRPGTSEFSTPGNDEDEKMSLALWQLSEMFPAQSEDTLRTALLVTEYNVQRAVEKLLLG